MPEPAGDLDEGFLLGCDDLPEAAVLYDDAPGLEPWGVKLE